MRRRLKTYYTVGKEAFDFYRKRAKHRNVENTPKYSYHGKILSTFWEKVAEGLIERRGGVYVEGLGYFCIVMHPEKAVYTNKLTNDIYTNAHTQSRLYFPVFIPERSAWTLKTFNMDRNFSMFVKKGISKKLKAGFKYLNFFTTIKKIFVNKFVLKKNDR